MLWYTGRWMRALQICCKYKRIEASDVLHKARDRSLVQFEINWAPQLVSCAEHKTHTTRKSTSKKIEWEYTVCHTHTHAGQKRTGKATTHCEKKNRALGRPTIDGHLICFILLNNVFLVWLLRLLADVAVVVVVRQLAGMSVRLVWTMLLLRLLHQNPTIL